MKLNGYSPRASARRSPLITTLIAAVTIAVLVAIVVIGYEAPNSIPGRSYYTVSAELTDAANIGPHTVVRIGGVSVGQVLNLRFENGRPVVDLQLSPSVAPLRPGTTVRIRPQSAIGEPYVDLRPGRSGQPIADGGRLQPGSTAAVPLDRVLQVFDTPTRTHFEQLMSELGTGTLGAGRVLGGAIDAAPAMLADLSSVTTRLAQQPAAIPGFISGAASVSASIASVRGQLADMFRPAADVMGTVASQRQPLGSALELAPATMQALDTGLARVAPAVTQLRMFAAAAMPALRVAPAALRQASGLFTTVRSDVPPLNRTLELAGNAVSPALKLLDSARADVPSLDRALTGASPVVDELAPRRCDIVRLARNWSNMFAFGEPKATGTNLQVDLVTPDFKSVGGSVPSALTHALPWLSDPYPAPCQSWTEVDQLAQGGK